MRTATSLLLLIASASALSSLPHRCRGGSAWAEVQRQHRALLGDAAASTVAASTFSQSIDHFGANDTKFNQRYWINDTFLDPKAPLMFLNIEGEGPASGPPGGFIGELGAEHKAMLASLEHRFYGDSVPVDAAGVKDFSVPTLHFLAIKQVLADINNFILNVPLPASVDRSALRVFTFGGSYSGALSAWFREVYPNATVGSLSSSGVVNAIFEFTEFDEQVAESAGASCSESLRAITRSFEAEWDAGNGEAMKALFNASDSGMNEPDFFYMLADSSAMQVQYGQMHRLCDNIPAADTDPATLRSWFAEETMQVWGEAFASDCFYSTSCLRDTPSQWQPTSRSWRWQKCFELAYLQSAPKEGAIRSQKVSIDALIDQCRAAFLIPDMMPSSKDINARLGGASPQETQTYYAQGSQDPWQRAGVQSTLSSSQPEYTAECDSCGHCGVLESYATSEAVQHSRALFSQYLAKWLSN